MGRHSDQERNLRNAARNEASDMLWNGRTLDDPRDMSGPSAYTAGFQDGAVWHSTQPDTEADRLKSALRDQLLKVAHMDEKTKAVVDKIITAMNLEQEEENK